MSAFLQAMSHLGTLTYWYALFAAIGIGIIAGFIPGLGATLVTALMVVFVTQTIHSPAVGIVMLAMVSSLDKTLDTIPAVLVGLPSSETQVAYLEGHQLARQGKGAHTMGAIYGVSIVGGLVGAACLAIAIPLIQPFILEFGYGEIAVLSLFGIAMVGLLSRGGIVKGIIGGLFGILLGTVGVDPLSGAARFTLGQVQLWQGLPLIATILGIFALPELVDLIMTRESVAPRDTKIEFREILQGFRYGLSRWKMTLRQSMFGAFLGAIPGLGGAVIDWLAYALGVSLAKDKEARKFGKGSLDGVLFAESAQHSKAGGQALPTLALGVPASNAWAIILAAILAYGISPGPPLLKQYAEIPMLMVITLAVGNVIVAMIGLVATNWLTRITRIPYPTVGFLIVAIVFLGSFMDMNSWLAIPIVLIFGVGGLVMKRYRWPRPPLILGFILGPVVDKNLQSALSVYGTMGLLKRPIVIILAVILIAAIVFMPKLMSPKAARRALQEYGDDDGSDGGEGPPTTSPERDGAPSVSSDDAGARRTDAPVRGIWFSRVLRQDNIAPLVMIGCALPFVIGALGYPARARVLPLVLGVAIVGLSLVQLTIQVARAGHSKGEVMDLGMRSLGMAGAKRAGLVVAAVVVLFLLISLLVGIQYAAVVLAAVGPMLVLKGKIRWVSGLVCGVFVAAFAWGVMQNVVGVLWPQPILGTWLQMMI